MAQTADYGLGPQTYPRGWFIVASSEQLGKEPIPLRYFGQDFALYRGESGQPVLLDAYCAHMGTHLAASKSAMIVKNGKQIEGDSIRCPYHGWRYAPDGTVDDIPYHDGPCPKSAAIRSYPVRDVMGLVMMWFDPNGAEPDFEPPCLAEWDDPQWVGWEFTDLGIMDTHQLEFIDNMADVWHLGPTHGQPCEYFENDIRDHVLIQRQGGFMQLYDTDFYSCTWYSGPAILISKQVYDDIRAYVLIAHLPIEDGRTQLWHGIMIKGENNPATDADRQLASERNIAAIESLGTDFEIWKNKRAALKIMQLKTDGPFNMVRKWYSQYYTSAKEGTAIQGEVNGQYSVAGCPTPAPHWLEHEVGLFE